MPIRYGSAPRRFQSTWDTTQAGSNNNQVVLPLVNGGSYDFNIDWGDGKTNRNNITTYNQAEVTHTYDETGIYEIRVVGGISGWRFNTVGDDDKILDISQWGPLVINDNAFEGCSLLTVSATDIFRLLDAGSMENSFRSCISLTDIPGLSQLDVSNINTLRTAFYQSFDFGSAADLNNWDTSNITNMEYVFFQTNFSGLVSGWDTSNVTAMRDLFRGCENFNDNIGNWNTSKVEGMTAMFQDCDSFNQDIGNWDVSGVRGMSAMFEGANNFNNGGSSSISGWDTSSCTNMNSLFQSTVFNQPIGSWNTSNVTDMAEFFRGNTVFDQDIGNWDVGKVTTFRLFFYPSPTVFNNGGSDSISGWDTSSVVNNGLEYMFYGCTGFNQPIGNWNISGATSLYNMFVNCDTFNQPLSGWDTSNITRMERTFYQAPNFNQDIGSWDTSSVSNMSEMFYQVTNFNNEGSSSISGWNTSGVTTMQRMFQEASSFDQPIGDWDVSNVEFMNHMLRQTPFNQDISNWNTSKVQDMSFMFYQNSSFNQPIGSWDTSSVTNMERMFDGTSAFDQDLSNWIVTGVTTFGPSFMNNVTLSTENYDLLLSGWAQQSGDLQAGISIGFGNSTYSIATGEQYKEILSGAGWTITDGGSV